LLVEDEDSVRQLVREFLTGLGYKLLESAEPESALALCDRHLGRIDLLMTDFIMPQMNGRELAARIVAIHPETRVLYMSGYAQESPTKPSLNLKGIFLPLSRGRQIRVPQDFAGQNFELRLQYGG
jgi:CheY-like chemotaxis protein